MIKQGLEAIVNNWLFFVLLLVFLRAMEWGVIRLFKRILKPLGKLKNIKALIIFMAVIIVVLALFNVYLIIR